MERSGVAAVYNLTVEDAHEYFANGILVSNCDAWRYSLINVLDIATETHDKSMTAQDRTQHVPEPARAI